MQQPYVLPKAWLADDPHAAHLPILHSIKDRLYIHHGRLLLRGTLGNNDVIIVPSSATLGLIANFHGCNHPGIPAMIKALQRCYYWPTLAEDVRAWVIKCNTCDRAKRGPSARQFI